MSYPNEASINIGASGSYTYTYGSVRKLTNIVREFDEEGRLVKETETITEYTPTQYYPNYPYQSQWVSGYTIN